MPRRKTPLRTSISPLPRPAVDLAKLEQARRAIEQEVLKRAARSLQEQPEGGLIEFVRYFWKILEPATPLVEGWMLWDMCAHLEAITNGKITRLLMNVFPGAMKSLLTDVFWPAYEWGPRNMPHLRYVAFSYSAGLTERDNGKFRALVMSPEYQELYSERFALVKVGEEKITNDKTGSKLASSVGGLGTGERGDRIIVDDPHNVKQNESEPVRLETVRWFREGITNRLNDSDKSAIVMICQRVHENDISGVILSHDFGYCHMMVPMVFENGRYPPDYDGNEIGWTDRRMPLGDEADGVLAWPERFSAKIVDRIEREVGPSAFAAQYQQRPSPRGGGIIKRSWWQPWSPSIAREFQCTPGLYPPMEYIVASTDTAFGTKKSNDPSACLVFGVWGDRFGARRIMLMEAWAERLEFNDLVERLEKTCKTFRVNNILIETSSAGKPAETELMRRYYNVRQKLSYDTRPEKSGRGDFGIIMMPPKGDKEARLLSVQSFFAGGLVFAPADDDGTFKEFAEGVIHECETFPKATHDDRVDCTSQAMLHLRAVGMTQLPEEREEAQRSAARYQRESLVQFPI